MADIAQVLATYDALVGVALGAGLTYGFGALNRRHQEARDDKTRWYEARLKAYIELSHALDDMTMLLFHPEEPLPAQRSEVVEGLRAAESMVALVGSNDFYDEAKRLNPIANRILDGPRPPTHEAKQLWMGMVLEIRHLARMDLGYADPDFKGRLWAEKMWEREEQEKHKEREKRERRKERAKKAL